MPNAIVVGAGLAGCEAALQLAYAGIEVVLYEMKPQRMSPAHRSEAFAELVCSNSLKAEREDSASGILKREMTKLHSVVMACAQRTRVPAGGALAVDREKFADCVTKRIRSNPRITVVQQEITQIPQGECVIIATGPLTDGALAEDVARRTGQPLSFYDAAAPIVSLESIDMQHAFLAGRYDQPKDYLNCPLNKEEYSAFYQALMSAERAQLHDFDLVHFEGCMPIEALAARGFRTPLFGPMSPKGVTDPRTGRWPFALLQLRRENEAGTMWNLVGFQTNLKFAEQKCVFGFIPALRNAEYLRYGVMHRNTYLPCGSLDGTLSLRADPRVRFAGQMTGVEGYMESAAMGICAGLFAARTINRQSLPQFGPQTAMGALLQYVSGYTGNDFQPMNINFGLIAPLQEPVRGKAQRHAALSQIAKESFASALRACGYEEEHTWN